MIFGKPRAPMTDSVRPSNGVRPWRELPAAALACFLSALISSCAIFPMVKWPELGDYALGMTYEEALVVTGDFTGTKKPPWPSWPPSSISVRPPAGARDMRLVFTGQCLSAIEVSYTGACEDGLVNVASRKYGAPLSSPHGRYLWSDGVRDVMLGTRPADEPDCKPMCTNTCELTYRSARVGLVAGPAAATHGLAACRVMDRRARVRWNVDTLHTIQRNTIDAMGYLLRVDSRP